MALIRRSPGRNIKQIGWDYIAIKNLTPPRGIKQYLFRDPKKWPNYIAELSDNDACMAMIEAITNILPNEEPKGDFSHQTDDSKKGEGKMIYYIVMNGKKIASLKYNKNEGTGFFLMVPGY